MLKELEKENKRKEKEIKHVRGEESDENNVETKEKSGLEKKIEKKMKEGRTQRMVKTTIEKMIKEF